VSVVLALVAPVFLVALYGFYRIQRMQDVLAPDWQILVEFGAALRALVQSAGHDARALAAVVALAPDVEPLVFGFRAPAASAALGPEVLFADLANLPRAWDDPATRPEAAAERARVENLQGQVLGAEWLLESERTRLARAEGRLPAWLNEGAAGCLLAVIVPWTGGARSARTRRRMCDADPRFRLAARVLAGALVVPALAGIAWSVVHLLRTVAAKAS